MLDYKFTKLQNESQQSVSFLEAKVIILEEKLKTQNVLIESLLSEMKKDKAVIEEEMIKNEKVVGKQIFDCEQCPKTVWTQRGLSRHVKTKHPKVSN